MLRKYIYIFLISMVPLVELRGAIPIAQGMHELDPAFSMPLAYVIAVVGNMLPVPVIFFFARKVLEWGADKPVIGGFFTFCLEKGHKGGEKLKAKSGKGLYWALLLFVGIPVPGTGAWTGTLAASLLDMDFKKSVLHVMGGVLLAGVIMATVSALVAGGIAAVR
ncbi:MAG: small multi-drug export protein [Butyrivibrio sp.]|nr:small multi-drug export protein [Butyrivibrio sp.]